MAKDYYGILGISPDADASLIRKAYRLLVLRCHPDTREDECPDNFFDVQEAYDILSDPERRKAYDRSRASIRRRVFGMTSERRTVEDGRRARRRMHGWFFAQTVNEPRQPDLEVLLSTEEARRGGWVPVDVPVGTVCPACRGDVFETFFCRTCNGSGVVGKVQRATLVIPPRVKSGTMLKLPVSAGGKTTELQVLVLVEG